MRAIRVVIGAIGKLFTAAVLAAAVGCSGQAGASAVLAPVASSSREPVSGYDVRAPLRTRADPMRKRLWTLHLDRVEVYDLSDRRLIRKIDLPAWSVALGVCMPALALDRAGAAVIAANAHPTLWRIDPVRFKLQQYEVRLSGREGWAIGFGALTFDGRGDLFAVAATGNSLWRIDLRRSRAELVRLYDPPLERCAGAGFVSEPAH